MSAGIRDMLSEHIDKFLISISQKDVPFVPCIFCTVLNVLTINPRKTMLSNRGASYVPSIVLEPICF